MRPLTAFKSGVGGLILLCVVLRALAWLVAPALPLLIVLFAVASVLLWLVFPNRRL